MKIICIKNSKLYLLSSFVIISIFLLFFSTIKSKNIEYSDYEKELINYYNEKKLLVLTFDDGPSKHTLDLLEILKNEDVKATFFILGENAVNNKDIITKENEYGNLVEIHSYKHVFFTKISKEQIEYEISTTQNIICDAINTPALYIRVPYGILNDNVKKIIKEQGLQSVLWSVDSLDWKYQNADKTFKHVINTTSGNDIILMHDIYDESVKAAEMIIKYYKNLGYKFVTINDFVRIQQIIKSSNS